ncbi:MAG TPA: hypothetical protein PKE40_05485 [Arachnia sp.]|nr:hypothetical protein [Arachnia sp.]HMT85788.1 hypothetical protein [Arachnia sp.]
MTTPHEPMITRRSATTAALWSVPVIAATTQVPHAAATESTCEDSQIQFGWSTATMVEQNRFTDPALQNQPFTNTVAFLPESSLPGADDLPPVMLTIDHVFHGNAYGVSSGGNEYATIDGSATPNGVALAPGIYDISQRLEPWVDTPPTANDWSDWTFTFGAPVSGLSFTIADVDRALASSGDQQFIDGVAIHSADAPLTFSFGTDADFVGDGSIADPFRVNPSATTGNLDYDDPRTHINVHASGSITTFTIRYFNLAPNVVSGWGISAQGVYLASFSFTGTVPCTP